MLLALIRFEALAYQSLADTSRKPASPFAAAFSALNRKVTLWARVQVSSEPNRPSPTPAVTPFSTAHATALAYQVSAGTSVKLLSALGSGEPAARHRKVTIWARVQGSLEPNRSLPIPLVMPFSTAHFTAS